MPLCQEIFPNLFSSLQTTARWVALSFFIGKKSGTKNQLEESDREKENNYKDIIKDT